MGRKLSLWLLPNLLVFPMISHWILPEGFERNLYIEFWDITLYIPNFCYLAYFILALHAKKNKENAKCDRLLFFLIFILFIYTSINLIFKIGFSRIDDIINTIINNYSFIYSPILFILLPHNFRQIQHTSFLVIGAWGIISLEIILYSLGFLTYQSSEGIDLRDVGQSYGDIFRISTTIGAATGTAIVEMILGIICSSFYLISQKFKIIVLIVTTISLFYTVSRGSIIVWSVYLIVYVYRNFIHHLSFNKKIVSVISIIIMAVLFINVGLFEPLKLRQISLEENGNVDTGRDIRVEQSFQIYNVSDGLGVGCGQVYPDKSLQYGNMKISHKMSPHNTYLVWLAELGVPGLTMIILLFFHLLLKLDYSFNHSISIPFILIISLNTESIFLWEEFMPLLFFLFMISLKNSININPKISTVPLKL